MKAAPLPYIVMADINRLFLRHQAQTSTAPLALHIVRAAGNYLYDADGKAFLDLIGGISVCNVGHRHPEVVAAIKKQADAYLHIMVYGELVQSPPAAYAALLVKQIAQPGLDSVYFTNSGSEAVEGAMKLARRLTRRPNMVSAINSYHGSTLGALSIMGDEYWRNAYRPLLPGVRRHGYNSADLINAIDDSTSCVVLETIQAEAGLIAPDADWIKAVRARCTATGTLLILDEIQCAFGRTGKVFGFDHYGVVPDILLLGKALGGGMPLGAFISSYKNMQAFTHDPVLGHITTFGGHPVSCAAGMAAFLALINENMTDQVEEKGKLLASLLQHESIQAVRYKGLLMAIEMKDAKTVLAVIAKCLEAGLFSDWFLFAPHCIRIAPPLTITAEEIRHAAATLIACMEAVHTA